MQLVVGIGEYGISGQKEDDLKTFALASCVALTAYHPFKKVAGLIHIALPYPVSLEEAKLRPYYYASTGIPLMLEKLWRGYGCRKEELLIGVYGGANSTRKDDYFKIGPKNIEAVHQVLREMSIKIGIEQTGGTDSRSLVMDVSSGIVNVIKQPLHLV